MKKSVKYLKILVNLLVAVAAILCICFLVPKVLVFFMPFVVGWVISMIANPLVHFLDKKLKIARKHGSIMITVVVIAAIIGLGYLCVSRIVIEAVNLVENLPEIYAAAQEELSEVGDNLQVFYDKLPRETQQNLADAVNSLSVYITDLIKRIGAPTFNAAGNLVKNLPNALVAIIISILSSYFFTADREAILQLVKTHMPQDAWKRVSGVWNDLKSVVGGYFKAQFKIMGIIYVVLVVGLLLMRVNYVLLVGLLIAFLDMLPFFGTGTVLFPWAVLKVLSGDYKMAVGLVVLYGVTQVVRQVVQPKIVGDTIGLNPLATLFFMYIGYKVSSVIGMIVAVPLGMILINLYKSGVFDNQIRCIRELVNDINEFRRL